MNIIMHNINVFLVFAIVLQALLFGILFFRSAKKNPVRILGIYELFYFINYSAVLLYVTEEQRLFISSYYIVIPLLATFPVLFYLFIRKLTRGFLQRKDALHFVFPALLLLVNIIILLFLEYNEKYSVIYKGSVVDQDITMQRLFLSLNKIVYPALLNLQPFAYIVLCARELIFLWEKIKEEYSYIEEINLKWAAEFLVIFGVLFVISIFLGSETYSFSFILTINLIIGIEGVRLSSRFPELDKKWEPLYETVVVKDRKYVTSPLSEIDRKDLYEKIIEYITDAKKYLNEDFRLSDVAEGMNTNRQYISQAINECSGTNFYHFINQFRIREFIQQCHSDQFRNKTIEGMGSMIGFKSKSSFFSEFKKIYGCTPKEYLKANIR